MKWFLRRSIPPITRILLIESGPRQHAQLLIPRLRTAICGSAPIDLFTCLPDLPAGLGADTRAWRSYEARNHSARWHMLLGLRRERHSAAAILCGESPLLGIWKLVLAALLPAKILLVDDRHNIFWLDFGHWRKALQLGISWSGVRHPEFARKTTHLLLAPFALVVLLGFAAKAHIGRLVRTAAR